MTGNPKSKIENPKWLGDSAERTRAGGSGDSIGVRREAKGVSKNFVFRVSVSSMKIRRIP